MGNPVNIEDAKVFTVKQVVMMIVTAITITFTVTMIYAEFRELGKDFKNLKTIHKLEMETLHEKINGVNGRVKRIYGEEEPVKK